MIEDSLGYKVEVVRGPEVVALRLSGRAMQSTDTFITAEMARGLGKELAPWPAELVALMAILQPDAEGVAEEALEGLTTDQLVDLYQASCDLAQLAFRRARTTDGGLARP